MSLNIQDFMEFDGNINEFSSKDKNKIIRWKK